MVKAALRCIDTGFWETSLKVEFQIIQGNITTSKSQPPQTTNERLQRASLIKSGKSLLTILHFMVDRIKKSWICYCLVGHPLEHSSALLILQLCMEVIDVSTTQSNPAVTIHAVTDASYYVHVPLGKLSKLFGDFHLAKLKFCLHPPTETRRFWLCWSKRPHIKRIKQPWIFCCCLYVLH